jgi:hypothetical protein
MQNKQIDGLAINHSPAPLPKQERMWALEAKEMEPFSKIDLKDVSQWMSIEDAYRPRVSITNKLSKEGCIFLIVGRRISQVTHRHD